MKVIRVIIYEGPEEWVRATYRRGQGVPWRGTFQVGPHASLKSTVDDVTKEVLERWLQEEEAAPVNKVDELVKELE